MNCFPTLFAFSCLAIIALPPMALAMPADCSKAQVPDAPVKGTVNGKPFIPNAITVHLTRNGMGINEMKFDRYELAIETDGIFNEMTTDVLVRSGARPDGHVFRMLPNDSIGEQPAAGPGMPEVQGWDLELEAAKINTSFTQETASMRLEFLPRKGDTMPGRIYFCVPGVKAEIMGTFAAKVRN
jgi:hypothetical protein